MAGTKTYEGANVRIHFDVERCIHARACVLGQPSVFREIGRPWVTPDGAAAEEIAETVRQCPSGALSIERTDGVATESAPAVNRVRLWEHGPLEFRAELKVGDEASGTRAVLCRCGASANKPWCDNAHKDIAFKATSEPKPKCESLELEERTGPVTISAVENGPMNVKGNLEIIAGSGARIACTKDAWLCRCGASANKPFCDGSHRKTGFTADPT